MCTKRSLFMTRLHVADQLALSDPRLRPSCSDASIEDKLQGARSQDGHPPIESLRVTTTVLEASGAGVSRTGVLEAAART